MTLRDDLAQLFTEKREQFIDNLASQLEAAEGTIYADMKEKQRNQAAESVADAIVADFTGTEAVEEFAKRIALIRVRDPHYNPMGFQHMLAMINTSMKTIVKQAYPEINQTREEALELVDGFVFRDLCTCYNVYTLERERALKESAAEQERLIEMLRELSSPIMPVHDSILVLPIVGAIDTHRAQIIMEDLLEAIVERQADMVIIDITGVPLVDTAIANYLIQTTKAVHLLGAQVILVGISAEVAQTLVGLSLDLHTLMIRANLQDGITYALEVMGLTIEEIDFVNN